MPLTKLNNQSLSAVTAAGIPIRSGSVLQVISVDKKDVFDLTSNETTFTDVTGLSVQITPSATTSKILVTGAVVGSAVSHYFCARLMRDNTQILVPDSIGNRIPSNFGSSTYQGGNYMSFTNPIHALDSPASTSLLTYKIQIRAYTGGVYVNKTPRDENNAAGYDPRGCSSITVMEIAG